MTANMAVQNQMCEDDASINAIAYTGHGMPVAIFFVVFIVISGLVVMSLFIGVITTSMVEATENAKTERKEEKQKKARAELLDEFSEELKQTKSGKPTKASTSRSEVVQVDDVEIKHAEQENACMESYLKLGKKVKDPNNWMYNGA